MAFVGLAILVVGIAPSSWRPDRTVDGMRVERRAVRGSSFDELRVTTDSPLSLASLCDAVWGEGAETKTSSTFKKRVVIRETENERWTYEQIRVPVVCDRD